MSDAAAALQAAVQTNHFGVMQVHLLKETMQKKGVVFASECVIVEVCQLQLEGVAQEVEATILKIMEEAAAG